MKQWSFDPSRGRQGCLASWGLRKLVLGSMNGIELFMFLCCLTCLIDSIWFLIDTISINIFNPFHLSLDVSSVPYWFLHHELQLTSCTMSVTASDRWQVMVVPRRVGTLSAERSAWPRANRWTTHHAHHDRMIRRMNSSKNEINEFKLIIRINDFEWILILYRANRWTIAHHDPTWR